MTILITLSFTHKYKRSSYIGIEEEIMKNIKTKATVNYNYNLGNMIVQGKTTSNYVEPFIREVIVRIKRNADKKYFKPGDLITYTLVLTNDGNYHAEEVIINENIAYQTLVEGSVKLSCIEDAQPFKFIKHDNHLEFIITNLKPHRSIYIQYQTIVGEAEGLNDQLKSSSTITIDNMNKIEAEPVVIEKKYAKVVCHIDEIDFIYP